MLQAQGLVLVITFSRLAGIGFVVFSRHGGSLLVECDGTFFRHRVWHGGSLLVECDGTFYRYWVRHGGSLLADRALLQHRHLLRFLLLLRLHDVQAALVRLLGVLDGREM